MVLVLETVGRMRRSRDDMLGIAVRYLVCYAIVIGITSVSMISDLLLLLLRIIQSVCIWIEFGLGLGVSETRVGV